MIVDARSVPRDETVETDVCIVGAGVAGITLAREFMDAPFEVCLLESGDLKIDHPTQDLCKGESIGQPYFPLEEARARYFGGTANFWDVEIGEERVGVRLRPLDPIDFEKRDWVPHSGWPFGRSELDPFYDRAQTLLRVDPRGFEVKDWSDPTERPQLPFVNDRVETVIFKLGWREVLTKRLCYEVKDAENILTFLFANVIDIETEENAKSVTRLRVACLEGNQFWVKAKIFVLAAGGIETPRFLLLSNKRQNAGLGNGSDLVGRFFMEHLHFLSGVYVPSTPAVFESTGLYSRVHTVRGVPVVGKLALSEEALRSERLLNQNFQLIPRDLTRSSMYPYVISKGVSSFQVLGASLASGSQRAEGARSLLANVIADWDGLAVAAYRLVRRRLVRPMNNGAFRGFRLAHMAEQVPNPESRVTLSSERDSLGQNCVQLNWKLTSLDLLSVVRTQKILDQELRRSKLGRLVTELRDDTPPADLHGGYHHMGTTRMHSNPAQGVVDEHCRVHGISNLFIAGPSVFPTGGYANPTLTLVALAIRLADRVNRIMRSKAD